MNWENEVRIHGYDGEFSVIALKMLLLILRTQDVLDYFMERGGTAGYQRAYYRRNAEKRRQQNELNIRKKYGMRMKEYGSKYRNENRESIRAYHRKYNRKYKERKKLERMWE